MGDWANMEGNGEGFSWLVEVAQEEQQHQPTCTWISKPATQALATVQCWNNSQPLTNKHSWKMREQIKVNPKEERWSLEANLKRKQSRPEVNNQTLCEFFSCHKLRKGNIYKILLGNVVLANAESDDDDADKVLTLLLGSDTNKGRAEAGDCGCWWGSGRNVAIFVECCCSDSCWFLYCFIRKFMERNTERERDDQVWLLFWFARASKLGYGEDEVCKRLL